MVTHYCPINVTISSFMDVNVLSFVSFLVGRGAHDWAVSHGIPPCPSEKMATSEFCYTDSEICFILDIYFLYCETELKTTLHQFEIAFFFSKQSSVYLRIRGTSERWSWQKKWTRDIIRQREDDNQMKM